MSARAEVGTLNWRRIVVFSAALFAATAAAAFPFGFVSGFLSSRGEPVPSWVSIGPQLAVPAAAIAVFFVLGRRQDDRPWLHALAICVVAWLISFPLNVLLLGQPLLAWGLALPALSVAQAVGLGASALARR